LGKTGGVGPLPGPPDESGVAVAPEERLHPEDEILGSPGTQVSPEAAAGTAAMVLTGAAPVEDAPKVMEALDKRTRSLSMGQDEGQTHKVRTVPGTMQQLSDPNLPSLQGPTSTAYDTKKYPCQEKPDTVPGTQEMIGERAPQHETVLPPGTSEKTVGERAVGEKAGGEKTGDEKTGGEKTVGRDPRRASTGSTGHKVGFMDRLKGEAKVITGKLGKNEKKVEEGRHLMGKY